MIYVTNLRNVAIIFVYVYVIYKLGYLLFNKDVMTYLSYILRQSEPHGATNLCD